MPSGSSPDKNPAEAERLALHPVFRHHPRLWRENRYVYPVVSRRSQGLSIGINLNPDKACNFDCIYCCVDRSQPPLVRKVDLDVLAAELDDMAARVATIWDEPEFADTPPAFRRLNDFAFSGDGEPTAAPTFADAARLVVDTKQRRGFADAKVVIITDACFLTRPAVVDTLRYLDDHAGEIWAKLDAGTTTYFQQIARPSHSLEHVLQNIATAARERPIVIQSLFMRVDGQPPPDSEIDAYVGRLRDLLRDGAQIKLVQIYTVARRTAEINVTKLTLDELETIAARVRELGVPAACYP